MERKIGEIFEFGGEWYQCVNTGFSCADCDIKGDCSDTYIGACSSRLRKDGKQVRFKKLKKVGEPIGFTRGSYFQRYRLANSTAFYEGDTRLFFNTPKKTFVYIEIKQNKEDMENKKLFSRKVQLRKEDVDYVIDIIRHVILPRTSTYDSTIKEIKQLFTSKSQDKENNLKPFNLEAAKQGKPVCTRNGYLARIICFDAKFPKTGNIVTLVEKENGEEVTLYHYDDGHCSIGRGYDLMMLPEKKEGWVNVYKTDCGIMFSKQPYSSKEEALKNAGTVLDIIDTVKVEWEE